MDSAHRDKSQSKKPDDQPEEITQERAETTDAGFNHPKALSGPIALIERLLAQGSDPNEGIQQLCERAIANPDALIEAASNYLAHLLTGGHLAACPDVPTAFLVEELAHEAAIISPLLVSCWAESGDSSHLLRLADGLIAQAERMKGADVGIFILAVAVDLAIQKPMRSLRLIEIGRGLVEDPGNNPRVSKARRWQAVGDFLRDGGATYRSFWQKRLTDEQASDWKNAEAVAAIAHLKKAQAKGKEIPPLFLDAIPSEIWSPPSDEEAASKDEDAAVAASDEREVTPARPLDEEKPKATHERIYKPEPIEKARVGFVPGFLIGGVTMLAIAAWIWKDANVPGPQPSPVAPHAPLAAAAMAVPKPDPVAGPVSSKQETAAPQIALPPKQATVAPTAAPAAAVEKQEMPAPKLQALAATSPAPVVAMITPAAESPPQTAARQPGTPAQPKHPDVAWRKAEFAEVARQHPALVRWHAQARTANWPQSQALLLGRMSYLPYGGDEFPHLLTLLLLDPPRDAEVAEAVPKIMARRMKTNEFVPLWEKLVYPGSPNEKEVRAAADAYLSVRSDSLTPSMIERLQKVARPAAP